MSPDPALPVGQTTRQIHDPLWLLGGHIAGFTRVLSEVEQFMATVLVILDEFPIPSPNRRIGRGTAGMIMRVVPADDITPKPGGGILQERPQIRSIFEGFSGRSRHRRSHRGGYVHGDHGLIHPPLGQGHSRPTDQQRHSNTPLIGRTLARSQRCVGSRRILTQDQPAVVRGEDHDRVIGEAAGIESRQNLPHRRVQAFQHRRIDGVGLGTPYLPGFLAILFHEPRLGLKRRVDRVEGHLKKERLFSMPADEGGRFSPLAIGQILPPRSVGKLRQSVRRKIGRWLAAMVSTEVEVEALLERPEPFPAEVPFSDMRCGTT